MDTDREDVTRPARGPQWQLPHPAADRFLAELANLGERLPRIGTVRENGRMDAQAARIAAVTFDAAGTLITVARPVGVTYAEVARSFGAELAPESLDAGFALGFPRMPPLAFPGAAPGEIPGLERDWWRELVGQVVKQAGGVEDFEPFFDALYESYARGGAWRAYPEALETLQWLKARGYRVGVVSNFDSRLENILRALELDHCLDALVYSSIAGAAKPDAGIFATALRALGTRAEEVLHVGDNERADLEGARAAGLSALRVDRSAGEREAHPDVISSLSELRSRL